jgi:hypothetical protein
MTDPYRHFYQYHPPDLSAITDLSHRHFRILLPRGRFLKIRDRIHTEAALRIWLIRYRPSDVYYSTSCWLVPENLGRRERTPVSDNIFLSSDIVFDIDRSPLSFATLDQAREDTLKLLDFCYEHDLPVKYIAFSGSKGFHVVCRDRYRYDNPDPFAREDMAREVRRDVISRVQAEGIRFDEKITADTRRILRVPGTINSKTGFACTRLTAAQLEQPAREILKYIPRADPVTPLIPHAGDESPLRGCRIISWLCHRFGVRSKPVTPVTYATFLINAVPGIRRQIPFFDYSPGRDVQKIVSELSGLQETYGLSDICLYRSEKEIAAVCLRTFPLRRLEKIIGASGSRNFGTLLKYKQLFLRVGEERDMEQGVYAGTPTYLMTIPAPDRNNEHFVSLPHYRFFSRCGTPMRQYRRLHGTGDVFLAHTVIERE